ncbi:RIB43A-like with coiled-coils protein 2 [Salarias fasciatus]|uniref:RIB43A-like with coiled-coils protein 2 n=1 Tax=Salarias fasciatus TaxID=181472 RepID=UPI001176DA85|nr:RIB43A-like with coiled-coils protein 2 [Salarias fasciatus]
MQVKEKKKKEDEAKKEQKAYDADVLHNTRAACILHNRLEKEKRAAEKAIVTYRQQQQQPWHRREYDLNDSDRWKKTHQDDAQMILPGLVGEDPESQSRQQRQRQQLRDWLIQQQVERDAEKRQQELEEQRYNQSVEKMNSEALRLQNLETERKKAAAVATKDYNLAKIEEKRRHELENDKDENTQGKQMGSDPAACVGVPGMCPSSDRRAPPESPRQVTQFQKHQMEERRRAESERKQEEDHLDRVRLLSARTALLAERQQARLDKQLRRRLDSTNAQLARTHKQQKPDIEKGSIDESFFSQFNTCSR